MQRPCAVVVGGSGFLGREVVATALRRGWFVVAADIRPDERLPEGAHFEKLDVTHAPAVEGLFFRWTNPGDLGFPDVEPPSMVFHVAALIPSGDASFTGLLPQDKMKLFAVNAAGTSILAQAAHRYGVSEFIFCSSASAIAGDRWEWSAVDTGEVQPLMHGHVDSYAASKAAAERALAETVRGMEPARHRHIPGRPDEAGDTMAWTIVRPVGIWGVPDDRYQGRIETSAQGGDFATAFCCNTQLSFSHVANVADVMVAAALACRGELSAPAEPGVELFPHTVPLYIPTSLQRAGMPAPPSRALITQQTLHVADGMAVNHGLPGAALGLVGFDCAWQAEVFLCVTGLTEAERAAVDAAVTNGSLGVDTPFLGTQGKLFLSADMTSPAEGEGEEAWSHVDAGADAQPVRQVLHPLKFLLTWLAGTQPGPRTPLGAAAFTRLPPALVQRVMLRARLRPGATVAPLWLVSSIAMAVETCLTLPAAYAGFAFKPPMSVTDIKWCARDFTVSTMSAQRKLGFRPAMTTGSSLLAWAADAQRRGWDGQVPPMSMGSWVAILSLYALLAAMALDCGGMWTGLVGGGADAWWPQRLPGYALCLTLLIHNREAAYAYERAAAWGAACQSWWLHTMVFGYPYPLALHAQVGQAHAAAQRLMVAYREGSILQGAGEGTGEVVPLEPQELSPPGTLVYLNLLRVTVFSLIHLVLADSASVVLQAASTWPFQAPGPLLLLLVRAAAWLLLEFAVFGHRVLFW